MRKNVKEKTNLNLSSFELIGLTDGLNIISTENDEPFHIIFADYKVVIENIKDFTNKDEREYKWLKPREWLKMNENMSGPYIREIIEKL